MSKKSSFSHFKDFLYSDKKLGKAGEKQFIMSLSMQDRKISPVGSKPRSSLKFMEHINNLQLNRDSTGLKFNPGIFSEQSQSYSEIWKFAGNLKISYLNNL